MNGIEKITARIDAQTQEEIDRLLADAKEQAAQITAQYRTQAETERASLTARSEKAAQEREERLVSVAQMEARKVTLSARQEMVERAYELALKTLCTLPQERYTAVLTDLLVKAAPDGRYIDSFKLKYDYHNVKALLKAEAMGTSADSMLMDLGRVPVAELKEAVRTGQLDALPNLLAEAVTEAREVLGTTSDPQLSDIVLDRWCYRDLAQVAESTGSAFLMGYVQTQIDAANLRTLVRTLRMGKGPEFLRGVLLEGGELSADQLLEVSANRGAGLAELYGPTHFQKAAEAAAEAVKGGSLTEFEKLCDDAVSNYLADAQFVPFGEAPLVGYLAARETEYTNLRILLMGRGAGLSAEVIRSRLRQSYV